MCNFMCHCNNNDQCENVTGRCMSGCAEGWYGPGCQYRNIINKWCRHSDNITSPDLCDLAYDNDTRTCSRTANATSGRTDPPWWRVWLSHYEYITELSFLTTSETLEYFQGFEVWIENVTEIERDDRSFIPQNRTLCFKHPVNAPSENSITVVCETTEVGNQVRIQLDPGSQLVLCDVKINGGRNVAFQGNVSLSSLYQSEPLSSVDGIQFYDAWNSCAGTHWKKNPTVDQWWNIDFNSLVDVKYVSLSSVNNDRMKNYQILAFNGSEQPRKVYDDFDNDPPTWTLPLRGIVLSRLKIQRLNVKRLVLCEVELFGDCAENTCGLECNKICHCRNTPMEDKISGHCSFGCAGRWTGNERRCDKECTSGQWGKQCENRCGFCKNSEPCDITSGRCLNGCMSGYKDTVDCTDECSAGRFGMNCSSVCSSHCRNNSTCRHTDGICSEGCEAGYTGDMCEKKCSTGRFGMNCSSVCSSHCRNNSGCRHTDGLCSEGCEPGYTGDMCEKKCPAATFGMNCNSTCSHHCKIGSYCRNTDGVCTKGCEPGYTGDTCEEKCSPGTFGKVCNFTCSQHCTNGSACRHTDGVCTEGCQAGYTGDACLEKCPSGSFGVKCNLTCSQHCKNGSFCQHTDGMCTEGCKPGYTGDMCEETCPNGTYGHECNTNCGYCMNEGTCHPVHGECMFGCLQGYTGSLCQAVMSDTDGSPSTLNILVIVLVIVMMIGLTSVLVWKRRLTLLRCNVTSKKNSSSSFTPHTLLSIIHGRNDARQGTNSAEDQITEPIDDDTSGNVHVNDQVDNEVEDAVYGNVSRYAIMVSELERVLPQKTANSYQQEFSDVRSVRRFPTTAAERETNRFKNKYKDMFAYDHNRVKLKLLNGDPDSDYINASFIKGYRKERAYIAAQGPIVVSINDFWRMIWEKNIRMVIMLTNVIENGKSKCLQYWGQPGEKQRYGNTCVTVQREDVNAEFTIREMSLSHHARPARCVVQFHYTAWPDKGVPKSRYSLQHFWRKVRQNDENKSHTWLVHCSAGVGRTGTFIAMDLLFEEGSHTRCINIHDCVKGLREQRPCMVQAKEQYMLLHLLMADMFKPHYQHVHVENLAKHITELSANDGDTGKTKLSNEFQTLRNENEAKIRSDQNSSEKPTAVKDCFATAKLAENRDKNRLSDVLASDDYRVILSTTIQGRTNYINAVYLPSYEDLKGYIVTQDPLASTCIDYYRLIVENEIALIITFPEESSDMVVEVLPQTGSLENGPFTITFISESRHQDFTHRKYCIAYKEMVQTVDQLIYEEWPSDEPIPSNENSLDNLMAETRLMQSSSKEKPTLVQCWNGVERCGLFVTLMNIVDYARFDNEVSVPLTVRHLRERRSQIISTVDQYKYLYDALARRIEGETTYANI